MQQLAQLLEFIQKLFVWWVTVTPWEQAIHVRGGKKLRVVGAGVHLRIPFYDRVYIQTTRLRITQGPPQTVTTSDGKAITIVVNLGYSITDIRKVYAELYQVENTLMNILQGAIADEVSRRQVIDCHPADLEKAIIEKISQTQETFGLKYEYTKITNYAIVKTFRLIQQSSEHWVPDGVKLNEAAK